MRRALIVSEDKAILAVAPLALAAGLPAVAVQPDALKAVEAQDFSVIVLDLRGGAGACPLPTATGSAVPSPVVLALASSREELPRGPRCGGVHAFVSLADDPARLIALLRTLLAPSDEQGP